MTLKNTILFLFLCLRPVAAKAASLVQVMVFIGDRHAKVLLLLDGTISDFESRSAPPMGTTPARASVLIRGAVLSPSLKTAYQSVPGGTQMDVAQAGIDALLFTSVSAGLQIVVEMQESRTLSVFRQGDKALLLDLRVPRAPPDDSLPDPEFLSSWMSGLSLLPQAASTPNLLPKIIVDAGHGGKDLGAVGKTGTQEKDIVLELARMVAKELRQKLGADVILTRDDDTFVPLVDRAAKANASNADLFISIHANAAPSPKLHGIETYYLDTASDESAARVAMRENAALFPVGGATEKVLADLAISGNTALSRRLAFQVHNAAIVGLSELYGQERIHDLGVKTALFYVLVSTRIPAILFEAPFLSNPNDEMMLRTPAFKSRLASSIVMGIQRYLEANSSTGFSSTTTIPGL